MCNWRALVNCIDIDLPYSISFSFIFVPLFLAVLPFYCIIYERDFISLHFISSSNKFSNKNHHRVNKNSVKFPCFNFHCACPLIRSVRKGSLSLGSVDTSGDWTRKKTWLGESMLQTEKQNPLLRVMLQNCLFTRWWKNTEGMIGFGRVALHMTTLHTV